MTATPQPSRPEMSPLDLVSRVLPGAAAALVGVMTVCIDLTNWERIGLVVGGALLVLGLDRVSAPDRYSAPDSKGNLPPPGKIDWSSIEPPLVTWLRQALSYALAVAVPAYLFFALGASLSSAQVWAIIGGTLLVVQVAWVQWWQFHSWTKTMGYVVYLVKFGPMVIAFYLAVKEVSGWWNAAMWAVVLVQLVSMVGWGQLWDDARKQSATETGLRKVVAAGVGFLVRVSPILVALAIGYALYELEAIAWKKVVVALASLTVVLVLSRISSFRAMQGYAAVVTGAIGLGGGGVAVWLVLMDAGFHGPAIKELPVEFRSDSTGASPWLRGDSIGDPALRAAFVTWATDTANIKFDSTTHGQSDRNYMDGRGTRGLIVAADNIHNTEHTLLENGGGRLLWYIRLTGDSGYPSVRLPKGRSFVIVDSFIPAATPAELDTVKLNRYVANAVVHDHPADREHIDSTSIKAAREEVRRAVVARYLRGGNYPAVADSVLRRAGTDRTVLDEADSLGIVGFARGIVIPEDPNAKVRVIRITVKHHWYWSNGPQAQWMGPGSFHPWSNCDTHGCCEGWYCSNC